MKTTICYLTDSGNSLWVAETLAYQLGEAELISMADGRQEKRLIDSKVTGPVFQVHMWGMPRLVLDFVGELKDLHPDYIFAVAVNAGQVVNTLVQLKKVLMRSGLNLSPGFEIRMPSNYIRLGRA